MRERANTDGDPNPHHTGDEQREGGEHTGQALNADAEGVGAYKPLSSSLMPIPKRPCGSKVKSQPTGEIIDTKPVLILRRVAIKLLIRRACAYHAIPVQSVGHADSVRRFNPCAHWWSCPIRYARTLLKQPALSAGHRHLYDYPTPSHLNVLWGFGSLGGIGLHVQIVTGIVLAMHYMPHVVCAAVSIEHILREVYAGHVLRHAHANGASLFFIAV